MKTSSVTFRINAELKKEAEETLEGMGMTMSGAFTILAKAVVRSGKFPLEIMIDPFERAENQKELQRRISAIESGETTPVHFSMDELGEFVREQVTKNG